MMPLGQPRVMMRGWPLMASSILNTRFVDYFAQYCYLMDGTMLICCLMKCLYELPVHKVYRQQLPLHGVSCNLVWQLLTFFMHNLPSTRSTGWFFGFFWEYIYFCSCYWNQSLTIFDGLIFVPCFLRLFSNETLFLSFLWERGHS